MYIGNMPNGILNSGAFGHKGMLRPDWHAPAQLYVPESQQLFARLPAWPWPLNYSSPDLSSYTVNNTVLPDYGRHPGILVAIAASEGAVDGDVPTATSLTCNAENMTLVENDGAICMATLSPLPAADYDLVVNWDIVCGRNVMSLGGVYRFYGASAPVVAWSDTINAASGSGLTMNVPVQAGDIVIFAYNVFEYRAEGLTRVTPADWRMTYLANSAVASSHSIGIGIVLSDNPSLPVGVSHDPSTSKQFLSVLVLR